MNKKQTTVLGLILIAMLVVSTGCFGDPVKSDLEEYLHFQIGIEKEAQEVGNGIMGNMSGAPKSKEEILETVKNASEKMSLYIEKQKSYQPKTKEVQAIHAQGIQVFENTADWFKQFTTMVEADNLSQEQQNDLLRKRTEIVKSAKEYQEAVKKLAAEKKVDVKMKL